jgi:predicted nuclease of predicted toxin-antitoxin system
VLTRATNEGRVVVTQDKDFGELAFRWGLPAASGIILVRVRGSLEARTATLVAALESRDDWAGHFAVVEHDRIRMTPLPGSG